MSVFDLDINNYSQKELEDFVNLPPNYTMLDVENNINDFINKISSDNKLDQNNKQKVKVFLEDASIKLKKINADKMYPESPANLPLSKMMDNSNVIQSPPDFNTNKDLNPICIKTTTMMLNIDTKFRPNYYNTNSTNFSISLPNKISKALSMNLVSLNMPLTHYTISKKRGNSYFALKYSDSNPEQSEQYSVYTVIMLPDGNYEPYWQDNTLATDLANSITSLLQGASISSAWKIQKGSSDINSLYYDLKSAVSHINSLSSFTLDNPASELASLMFNVDRTSGRSVFSYSESLISTNFTIVWGVTESGQIDLNTNIQLKLGWMLGFRVNSYTGLSIVSEGICFCKSPNYGFLSVNDYQKSVNDCFISAFNSSYLSNEIIAKFNLNYMQLDNGIYQPITSEFCATKKKYFGPVDIEKLEIKILDEFGNILDLNNMDWSAVLSFECVYS